MNQAQWFKPIIPSTSEPEIRKIRIQGHPRQIVIKTLISTKKLSVVVHIYNSSCIAISRMMLVQTIWGKSVKPCPKKWFKQKRGWECDLSGRVPSLKVWSLEFKPQYHQEKIFRCIIMHHKENCDPFNYTTCQTSELDLVMYCLS